MSVFLYLLFIYLLFFLFNPVIITRGIRPRRLGGI